jgi:hypothetical protein
MAEADSTSGGAKDFRPEVPQRSEPFFLKGSNELDWGMKNRLSRIFDPTSGRTVMLAFDHGYFQGPTTGLERDRPRPRAAHEVGRHPDVHPGDPPDNDPADLPRRDRAAGERRPEHPLP